MPRELSLAFLVVTDLHADLRATTDPRPLAYFQPRLLHILDAVPASLRFRPDEAEVFGRVGADRNGTRVAR